MSHSDDHIEDVVFEFAVHPNKDIKLLNEYRTKYPSAAKDLEVYWIGECLNDDDYDDDDINELLEQLGTEWEATNERD